MSNRTVADVTAEIEQHTQIKARLTHLEDVVEQDEILAALQTERTQLIQAGHR